MLVYGILYLCYMKSEILVIKTVLAAELKVQELEWDLLQLILYKPNPNCDPQSNPQNTTQHETTH